MSTPEEAISGPYRGNPRRRGKIGAISLEGHPSPEEVAQHAEQHKGDAADRFSLYTPQQVEQATKDAKIAMTFGDVIKIRDQAEMVIACMQQVIQLTRGHDIGSINQRIQTRREVGSLVERLTLFNGRTPYGYGKKKR